MEERAARPPRSYGPDLSLALWSPPPSYGERSVPQGPRHVLREVQRIVPLVFRMRSPPNSLAETARCRDRPMPQLP